MSRRAEKMNRDKRQPAQRQVDQVPDHKRPVEPLMNPLIQFLGHGRDAALGQRIEQARWHSCILVPVKKKVVQPIECYNSCWGKRLCKSSLARLMRILHALTERWKTSASSS